MASETTVKWFLLCKSCSSMKEKKFHLVRVGRLPAIWSKVTADPTHLFLHWRLNPSAATYSTSWWWSTSKQSIQELRMWQTLSYTILAEEENEIRYTSGYVAMKENLAGVSTDRVRVQLLCVRSPDSAPSSFALFSNKSPNGDNFLNCLQLCNGWS